MVALIDASAVGRGGFDREANLDDSAGEVARDVEACVGEHAEHRPILDQHLRDELLDTAPGRELGELLEKAGADALSLVLVVDSEGDLRAARVSKPGPVRQSDDAFAAVFADHPNQRAAFSQSGSRNGSTRAKRYAERCGSGNTGFAATGPRKAR